MTVRTNAVATVDLKKLRSILLDMGLPEALVDILMSDEDDLDALCEATLSVVGFSRTTIAITVH